MGGRFATLAWSWVHQAREMEYLRETLWLGSAQLWAFIGGPALREAVSTQFEDSCIVVCPCMGNWILYMCSDPTT